MRTRILFCLLTLLSLVCESTAQRLPFTVYNTTHGLVHNRVHTMRQDDLGYLWIGTDIGIARFDGRGFKYYPSPGTPFVASPTGMVERGWAVFVLNSHGVVRCRGDSVQVIKSKDYQFGWLCGIASAPGGYLLAEVRQGIFHLAFDGTTKRVDSGIAAWRSKVLDLFRDSQGALWIGCSNGLLICPDGTTASARPHPYFDGKRIPITREGPDGYVYVACTEGLVRMHPVTSGNAPLPEPQMVCRQPEVNGWTHVGSTIWCASAAVGVTRIDASGHYETYSQTAGLPANTAWDALVDREGVLWFSTENGLVKLARTDVKLFDNTSSSYPGVKSGLILADGSFLFSDNKTLHCWQGSRATRAGALPSPSSFSAQAIMQGPRDTLWMSWEDKPWPILSMTTAEAVVRGGRLVHFRPMSGGSDDVPAINPSAGRFAHGGSIWARAGNRLVRYANGHFHSAAITGHDGQPADVVALCPGNQPGEVWVLDSGTYLIRCTASTDGTGSVRLQVAEHLPLLLRGKQYLLLHCSLRGMLFLGGKQGLATCKELGGDGGWACADYALAENSTSSNWITSFAEEDSNTVWIGTVAGLDKYIFQRPSNRIVRGLFRTELCGSNIYFVRVAAGRLFVGTTGCMAIVELGKGSLASHPPPLVHLTGVRVMGEARDSLLRSVSPVRFQPADNSIAFSFLGISFRDEKGIRYRYKLDGLDKSWSVPTAEASITYSRVPPGTYTFLVEAQSASGQWSTKPAAFSFTVLQPFYTRWWFILAVALVAAATIYGIYRYRLAQVMAIQSIRSKISKDLHDDIGATVSSIGILASIAGKSELKEEKRHQYLDTISDQSKYVAETLSDIVWAINPSNDSLEKLFARVLRYATELFEARGIDYTVYAPPDALRGLSLPMDARQNLYLLIKEAVNNLVKYSGAKHATIRVTRESGHLAVCIADDGKGFDPTTTTGNGLLNMRKRAESLHGALRIESKPGGGGTRVELDVPLKAGARMM